MTTSAHAIISGGSSGIGLSLAHQLASEGWCLTLIARDAAKLNAARQALTTQHRLDEERIALCSADVADFDAVRLSVQKAVAMLGVPDLVVANAGIVHPGEFMDLPNDVFRQTMETNYFGAINLIQATLPEMFARRKGHIVIVSSGAGLIGIHGYTSYAASKFALRGLAESLRSELKGHGIAVSVVYPPDTDTPQLEAENRLKPPAARKITANARVLSPDHVARTIMSGVKRRRFVVAPGWEMKCLAALHSVLAPLLRHYFDFLVRKTAAEEGSHPASGQ